MQMLGTEAGVCRVSEHRAFPLALLPLRMHVFEADPCFLVSVFLLTPLPCVCDDPLVLLYAFF